MINSVRIMVKIICKLMKSQLCLKRLQECKVTSFRTLQTRSRNLDNRTPNFNMSLCRIKISCRRNWFSFRTQCPTIYSYSRKCKHRFHSKLLSTVIICHKSQWIKANRTILKNSFSMLVSKYEISQKRMRMKMLCANILTRKCCRR